MDAALFLCVHAVKNWAEAALKRAIQGLRAGE